jgi:hypothetical protein
LKKYAGLLIATLALFLSMFVCMDAQTGQKNRTVVGSGGMVGIVNANGSTINSQTGQFAIRTLVHTTQGSDNYNLNQGFWIPEPVINTDVEEQFGTTNKDLYNYPNPVSISTTFEFSLKASSYITLKVYDMMGNEVKLLLDEFRTSGLQKIEWNTKGNNGTDIPAGSYMYEVQIRSTDITGAGSFSSYALRSIMIVVR